jgi:ribulose-5-phosphate 4-epimerase/fuculose-1-phosphate aldolase
MTGLLKKFTDKIINQKLSTMDSVLYVAVDDEIYFYGGLNNSQIKSSLIKLFDLMNINSLLVAFPYPPYNFILKELIQWGREDKERIIPEDCETRTFFHDIPVIRDFDSSSIYSALSERKSVIIEKGPAIVSYGTVSPEQAFVSFSSTCFSTFVKYFYDSLIYFKNPYSKSTKNHKKKDETFQQIKKYIKLIEKNNINLHHGLVEDEITVTEMIQETGKVLVSTSLVDSFFGNISVYMNETVYISETSASLDELEGAIDAVPIDGSSSVGITSSSEFPTHRAIYKNTAYRFLLHGHPKFSVIMSMYCEKDCSIRGECYRRCPEKRFLCNTPIVPGEIGTGRTGIVNTVPGAFKDSDAVIVFGHGVFAAGLEDFNHPFQRLVEIENCAMETYFKTIKV